MAGFPAPPAPLTSPAGAPSSRRGSPVFLHARPATRPRGGAAFAPLVLPPRPGVGQAPRPPLTSSRTAAAGPGAGVLPGPLSAAASASPSEDILGHHRQWRRRRRWGLRGPETAESPAAPPLRPGWVEPPPAPRVAPPGAPGSLHHPKQAGREGGRRRRGGEKDEAEGGAPAAPGPPLGGQAIARRLPARLCGRLGAAGCALPSRGTPSQPLLSSGRPRPPPPRGAPSPLLEVSFTPHPGMRPLPPRCAPSPPATPPASAHLHIFTASSSAPATPPAVPQSPHLARADTPRRDAARQQQVEEEEEAKVEGCPGGALPHGADRQTCPAPPGDAPLPGPVAGRPHWEQKATLSGRRPGAVPAAPGSAEEQQQPPLLSSSPAGGFLLHRCGWSAGAELPQHPSPAAHLHLLSPGGAAGRGNEGTLLPLPLPPLPAA